MATAVSYRYLGCSGLKVSNICLGTMTYGTNPAPGPKLNSEPEAHTILDRFAELGGNFIDTANCYQSGQSEQYIGTWLKRQERSRFVIATKVRANMGGDVNNVGLSRKHILDSVEASLERLQTGYIDLFQIHIWDVGTPIEETLSALNDLVRSGKVRYLGASNLCGWQLQKIVDVCRFRGYDKWITLQQQYSLLERCSEYDVMQVCRQEGMGVLPWSPLKGGMLTGKYKRDLRDLPEGARLTFTSTQEGKGLQSSPNPRMYQQDDNVWSLLDVVENIAKETGRTPAQVALRWLLQQEGVPSVIIGAKSVAQLEDNMAAAGGPALSQEQMSQLDEASAVELPYPHNMSTRLNVPRLC